MKSKALILLMIAIIVAAAAFFTVKPSHRPLMTQIGGTAEDFELVDMMGNKIKLSDMKGSVLFVNFWATWCGSCVEELPSIERLYKSMSGNPSFKMVTVLYRDDISLAAGYMKENGYSFPVFINPDESAAKIFGITGVPETYIIDKKGILRDKVLGPAEWDSPQAIGSFQALMKEP